MTKKTKNNKAMFAILIITVVNTLVFSPFRLSISGVKILYDL